MDWRKQARRCTQRALELHDELGPVLDAAGVRGEPLIGDQVIPSEHTAELREQPVVGGRDRDQAVLRPERLVGRDAAVRVAEARRLRAGCEDALGDVDEPAERAVQ